MRHSFPIVLELDNTKYKNIYQSHFRDHELSNQQTLVLKNCTLQVTLKKDDSPRDFSVFFATASFTFLPDATILACFSCSLASLARRFCTNIPSFVFTICEILQHIIKTNYSSLTSRAF